MANSPSETWENGVLVARAAETNRWKILPDGTMVGEDAAAVEPEPVKATKKAVSSAKAENKSVEPADTK